ncbi:XRE family transcriptional regulator [Streptomyces sp. S.PNR 29]|uniref:helix-turn-helix domain-containing protein n=1 Tax=Streptomyces sp. S.PNR 29 TaxID=2973805 RepID=UPI0025B15C24|nr:XRE family transcriptional regulator [Streptomyces sp. S.PNR 29]MDN0195244.1 XRE family transcriptional regulator [Streptomyces sp. S.PNR 29]
MPRWRALPDELDPQIREFAGQLRRLVDRSGLSIAALADRTGYSKTSWERYLNGRLLAPKGAIVALAEVTGTNPVHLTTMWELAERAWSRSEMRHDMTMEAIRISQARAALGELAAPPANAKEDRTARRSGSATVTPGIAGPAGVAPTVPPVSPSVPQQPTAAESADAVGGGARLGKSPDASASDTPGGPSDGNSWGLAGYRGPSPAGRPGAGAAPAPTAPLDRVGPAPGTPGEPPRGPSRQRGGSSAARKRLPMFVAGVVGVVGVIAGAFFLLDGGGKDNEGAKASPSPSVSGNTDLPAGVKCSGAGCTGKDAESMGCSGDLVTTAKTATVGTTVVEVRYSETCGAAWGRITQAAQGDEVQVTAGKSQQTGSITVAGDTIAYTPMVAVKGAAEATACATLASGEKGCTG